MIEFEKMILDRFEECVSYTEKAEILKIIEETLITIGKMEFEYEEVLSKYWDVIHETV